jgi:hypothetical protein
MADDDASIDELLGINDHHGAPEVQEVAPTAKDPIEEALLDDVEFIDVEEKWQQQISVNLQAQPDTAKQKRSTMLRTMLHQRREKRLEKRHCGEFL